MKSTLAAFGTGALFALGLVVSGMTQPSRVVGFLDVTGAWDPTLLFVMVGAVSVHFVAHRIIARRKAPLFDETFHLPKRKHVDARLVVGAALFGVGWALGGFCPGPGLVSAAAGATPALVFVAAMTIGMLLEHAWTRTLARARSRRKWDEAAPLSDEVPSRVAARHDAVETLP